MLHLLFIVGRELCNHYYTKQVRYLNLKVKKGMYPLDIILTGKYDFRDQIFIFSVILCKFGNKYKRMVYIFTVHPVLYAWESWPIC